MALELFFLQCCYVSPITSRKSSGKGEVNHFLSWFLTDCCSQKQVAKEVFCYTCLFLILDSQQIVVFRSKQPRMCPQSQWIYSVRQPWETLTIRAITYRLLNVPWYTGYSAIHLTLKGLAFLGHADGPLNSMRCYRSKTKQGSDVLLFCQGLDMDRDQWIVNPFYSSYLSFRICCSAEAFLGTLRLVRWTENSGSLSLRCKEKSH